MAPGSQLDVQPVRRREDAPEGSASDPLSLLGKGGGGRFATHLQGSWIRTRERTECEKTSSRVAAAASLHQLESLTAVTNHKSALLTIIMAQELRQLWCRPRELFAIGEFCERPAAGSRTPRTPAIEDESENSAVTGMALSEERQFWRRLRERLSKLSPEVRPDLTTLPQLTFSPQSVLVNPPFAGILPQGLAERECHSNVTWLQSDNEWKTTQRIINKVTEVIQENLTDNGVSEESKQNIDDRLQREVLILAMATIGYIKWEELTEMQKECYFHHLFAIVLMQAEACGLEDGGNKARVVQNLLSSLASNEEIKQWIRTREMNLTKLESSSVSKHKHDVSEDVQNGQIELSILGAPGCTQTNHRWCRPRELLAMGDKTDIHSSPGTPDREDDSENSAVTGMALSEERQFWRRLRERLSKLSPEVRPDLTPLPQLTYSPEAILVSPPFAGILTQGLPSEMQDRLSEMWMDMAKLKLLDDLSSTEVANKEEQVVNGLMSKVESQQQSQLGVAADSQLSWKEVSQLINGFVSSTAQSSESDSKGTSQKVDPKIQREMAVIAMAAFDTIDWLLLEKLSDKSYFLRVVALVLLQVGWSGSEEGGQRATGSTGQGLHSVAATEILRKWIRTREMNIHSKQLTQPSLQSSAAVARTEEHTSSTLTLGAPSGEEMTNVWRRIRELFPVGENQGLKSSSGTPGCGENEAEQSAQTGMAVSEERQFWRRLREKLSRLSPETLVEVSTLEHLLFSHHDVTVSSPLKQLLLQGLPSEKNGLGDLWNMTESSEACERVESRASCSNQATESSKVNQGNDKMSVLGSAAEEDQPWCEASSVSETKQTVGATTQKYDGMTVPEKLDDYMRPRIAVWAMALFGEINWLAVDELAKSSHFLAELARLIMQERWAGSEGLRAVLTFGLLKTASATEEVKHWIRTREMNLESTREADCKKTLSGAMDATTEESVLKNGTSLELDSSQTWCRLRELFGIGEAENLKTHPDTPSEEDGEQSAKTGVAVSEERQMWRRLREKMGRLQPDTHTDVSILESLCFSSDHLKSSSLAALGAALEGKNIDDIWRSVESSKEIVGNITRAEKEELTKVLSEKATELKKELPLGSGGSGEVFWAGVESLIERIAKTEASSSSQDGPSQIIREGLRAGLAVLARATFGDIDWLTTSSLDVSLLVEVARMLLQEAWAGLDAAGGFRAILSIGLLESFSGTEAFRQWMRTREMNSHLTDSVENSAVSRGDVDETSTDATACVNGVSKETDSSQVWCRVREIFALGLGSESEEKSGYEQPGAENSAVTGMALSEERQFWRRLRERLSKLSPEVRLDLTLLPELTFSPETVDVIAAALQQGVAIAGNGDINSLSVCDDLKATVEPAIKAALEGQAQAVSESSRVIAGNTLALSELVEMVWDKSSDGKFPIVLDQAFRESEVDQADNKASVAAASPMLARAAFCFIQWLCADEIKNLPKMLAQFVAIALYKRVSNLPGLTAEVIMPLFLSLVTGVESPTGWMRTRESIPESSVVTQSGEQPRLVGSRLTDNNAFTVMMEALAVSQSRAFCRTREILDAVAGEALAQMTPRLETDDRSLQVTLQVSAASALLRANMEDHTTADLVRDSATQFSREERTSDDMLVALMRSQEVSAKAKDADLSCVLAWDSAEVGTKDARDASERACLEAVAAMLQKLAEDRLQQLVVALSHSQALDYITSTPLCAREEVEKKCASSALTAAPMLNVEEYLANILEKSCHGQLEYESLPKEATIAEVTNTDMLDLSAVANLLVKLNEDCILQNFVVALSRRQTIEYLVSSPITADDGDDQESAALVPAEKLAFSVKRLFSDIIARCSLGETRFELGSEFAGMDLQDVLNKVETRWLSRLTCLPDDDLFTPIEGAAAVGKCEVLHSTEPTEDAITSVLDSVGTYEDDSEKSCEEHLLVEQANLLARSCPEDLTFDIVEDLAGKDISQVESGWLEDMIRENAPEQTWWLCHGKGKDMDLNSEMDWLSIKDALIPAVDDADQLQLIAAANLLMKLNEDCVLQNFVVALSRRQTIEYLVSSPIKADDDDVQESAALVPAEKLAFSVKQLVSDIIARCSLGETRFELGSEFAGMDLQGTWNKVETQWLSRLVSRHESESFAPLEGVAALKDCEGLYITEPTEDTIVAIPDSVDILDDNLKTETACEDSLFIEALALVNFDALIAPQLMEDSFGHKFGATCADDAMFAAEHVIEVNKDSEKLADVFVSASLTPLYLSECASTSAVVRVRAVFEDVPCGQLSRELLSERSREAVVSIADDEHLDTLECLSETSSGIYLSCEGLDTENITSIWDSFDSCISLSSSIEERETGLETDTKLAVSEAPIAVIDYHLERTESFDVIMEDLVADFEVTEESKATALCTEEEILIQEVMEEEIEPSKNRIHETPAFRFSAPKQPQLEADDEVDISEEEEDEEVEPSKKKIHETPLPRFAPPREPQSEDDEESEEEEEDEEIDPSKNKLHEEPTFRPLKKKRDCSPASERSLVDWEEHCEDLFEHPLGKLESSSAEHLHPMHLLDRDDDPRAIFKVEAEIPVYNEEKQHFEYDFVTDCFSVDPALIRDMVISVTSRHLEEQVETREIEPPEMQMDAWVSRTESHLKTSPEARMEVRVSRSRALERAPESNMEVRVSRSRHAEKSVECTRESTIDAPRDNTSLDGEEECFTAEKPMTNMEVRVSRSRAVEKVESSDMLAVERCLSSQESVESSAASEMDFLTRGMPLTDMEVRVSRRKVVEERSVLNSSSEDVFAHDWLTTGPKTNMEVLVSHRNKLVLDDAVYEMSACPKTQMEVKVTRGAPRTEAHGDMRMQQLLQGSYRHDTIDW